MKKKPVSRRARLAALARENRRNLVEMVRRWQALPMEKRTNFLRKRSDLAPRRSEVPGPPFRPRLLLVHVRGLSSLRTVNGRDGGVFARMSAMGGRSRIRSASGAAIGMEARGHA